MLSLNMTSTYITFNKAEEKANNGIGATTAGKVASEVNKTGAKSLIERIWNGPAK